MEQKQVIAYQRELFDINGQGVVCPFPGREAVSGAQGTKDLQVNTAGKPPVATEGYSSSKS